MSMYYEHDMNLKEIAAVLNVTGVARLSVAQPVNCKTPGQTARLVRVGAAGAAALRRLQHTLGPLHAELETGASPRPPCADAQLRARATWPGVPFAALWVGVRGGATMPPKCAVRWMMCSVWSGARPRPCRPWLKNSGVARAQVAITTATTQSSQSVQRTRRAGQCRAEVEGMSQTPSRSRGGGRHHPHFAADAAGGLQCLGRGRHAGDAGRGFGVVADAIKSLAAQVETSSEAIVSAIASLQTRIDHFSAQLVERDNTKPSEVHAAFRAVETEVTAIATSAGQSAHQVEALNARARELESEVGEAQRAQGGPRGQ